MIPSDEQSVFASYTLLRYCAVDSHTLIALKCTFSTLSFIGTIRCAYSLSFVIHFGFKLPIYSKIVFSISQINEIFIVQDSHINSSIECTITVILTIA